METNPLVGKTIEDVLISEDRLAIRFILAGGEPVTALCDADCCSYTWIENVEVPSLPARVMAVENIDMPEAVPARGCNGPTDTDSVAFYGLRITTDHGHLVIDYRNDSNGYYGGDLTWPGEYHYGGVHGQSNADQTKWISVSAPSSDRGGGK